MILISPYFGVHQSVDKLSMSSPVTKRIPSAVSLSLSAVQISLCSKTVAFLHIFRRIPHIFSFRFSASKLAA